MAVIGSCKPGDPMLFGCTHAYKTKIITKSVITEQLFLGEPYSGFLVLLIQILSFERRDSD